MPASQSQSQSKTTNNRLARVAAIECFECVLHRVEIEQCKLLVYPGGDCHVRGANFVPIQPGFDVAALVADEYEFDIHFEHVTQLVFAPKNFICNTHTQTHTASCVAPVR